MRRKQNQAVINGSDVDGGGPRKKRTQPQFSAELWEPFSIEIPNGSDFTAINSCIGVKMHRKTSPTACTEMLNVSTTRREGSERLSMRVKNQTRKSNASATGRCTTVGEVTPHLSSIEV